MAKSFKILFVSSEVYPFSKESGIADVSNSLPIALKSLGHDVRVISPKYGSISERKNKIHNISRLREVPIKVGDRTEFVNIKSSSLNSPKYKVQVYFTTNYHYFEERLGIYHDPITWQEYLDNSERFIFFSKSVLETCIQLKWIPDIVHCNDWQTALLPAFIRSGYSNLFSKSKIVFTIHNFYRQGIFPLEEFFKTGLNNDYLKYFEHNGKFNFMKGALHFSNFITTVSPTYREEILEDNILNNGLNNELKIKEKTFKGILNGIDNFIWNPRKDQLIHSKLNNDFLDFKYKNKIQLQKIIGLPIEPDIPLYGMIPRIGYQKGIGLFIESADKIFNNDIQFILLGQGDPNLKSQIINVAKKYPNKFKPIFTFDENLSHQIEAGSDFFLMPSQYEPCGLNLMYSHNYGTVPIVRATGGLKDTGINFNEDTLNGNSIVFDNYDIDDFTKAIIKSIKLYYNKDVFSQIIQNGLSCDYTWKEGVKQYDSIYRTIFKE